MVDFIMLGSFTLSFLSILLHIIIDNERQKIEDEKTSRKNQIEVLSMEGVSKDPAKKRTKTCIQRFAIFLAKVFFPLLNLLFNVSFFYMGFQLYNDEQMPITLAKNSNCTFT